MERERKQKEEKVRNIFFDIARPVNFHFKLLNTKYFYNSFHTFYNFIADAGTTKGSSADDAASDSGTAKSAK